MHNIPYKNIVSVRLDELEGLDANSAKIERMKADFKDNISSDQEETNFAIPGRKNLYIGSVFVRAHFRIDNKNKETDAESVMYIGVFSQCIKIPEYCFVAFIKSPIPSKVSWSVKAIISSPLLFAIFTNSSGQNEPSEYLEWKCKSTFILFFYQVVFFKILDY